MPGNFFAQIPGSAELARRELPRVGDALRRRDADGSVAAYRAMLDGHADLVVAALPAGAGGPVAVTPGALPGTVAGG